MTYAIRATYEDSVFKPTTRVELPDGQEVVIYVERLALTPEEAEAQLSQWHQVYAGLSDQEIEEVEAIALDRSHFVRERESD